MPCHFTHCYPGKWRSLIRKQSDRCLNLLIRKLLWWWCAVCVYRGRKRSKGCRRRCRRCRLSAANHPLQGRRRPAVEQQIIHTSGVVVKIKEEERRRYMVRPKQASVPYCMLSPIQQATVRSLYDWLYYFDILFQFIKLETQNEEEWVESVVPNYYKSVCLKRISTDYRAYIRFALHDYCQQQLLALLRFTASLYVSVLLAYDI